MSQVSSTVSMVANILRGEGGLQTKINENAEADSLTAFDVPAAQIIEQNVASDLAEKTMGVQYPCVHVYCEKIANRLREKGRIFSGQAMMAVEARVSSDRLDDIEPQMNVLVDAITGTLEQNRGDWGAGTFYGGTYEIGFGAVKHGGRNFIQIAKVTLGLDISR